MLKKLIHCESRLRGQPFSFYLGLWLAVTCSIVFQSLLVGEFGSDSSATPDSSAYLQLAQELQAFGHGEISTIGDLVRTPGYSMIILGAAALGGDVGEVKEAEIPTRDWSNTNLRGRRLVKHVILIQQIMGFVIPVILFLIIYGLTRWSLLALLGSMVFAFDISSVCYQFVLLTETASIATVVGVLALLVWVLRRPTSKRATFLGLAVSWAIILRPSFLLLAPLLFATLVIHGRVIRQNLLKPILLFVLTTISLPILWSTANLATFGHFFFTKNQTVTLQNFTSRHFVEMEFEDDDLRILQKYVRVALEKSPGFAMSRSLWQTAEEIGEQDIYEMYRLADRANRKTLVSNLGPFLEGAWARFQSMFSGGFRDVKNRHVQLRLEYLTSVPPGFFRDTKLLFGAASGILMVIFCIVTIFAYSDPVLRAFLIFSVLFALAFMFLSGAFDENEPIRHAMAARIVVNLVLVMTSGLLLRRICTLFVAWRLRFLS